MTGIVIGLYVASYLLAVFDGARSLEEGSSGMIYPHPMHIPRMGIKRYVKAHLLIVIGAACGIAATILELTR